MTGLRRLLSPLVAITATIARASSPWLMLAIRVWLGQAFLAHQIAMLMMGQSMSATLSIGSWAGVFAQIAATGFGGVVQALCPLLLAAGLFSRPAAAAMLLQTLLLRLPGETGGSGTFWGLLLLAILIFGPGAFSLDRLLRPAVRSAALPGLRLLAAAYAAVTKSVGPLYLLALRAVLASTVLAWHEPIEHSMGMRAEAYLPGTPAMIAHLPEPAAVAGAVLLLAGLAVRPLAVVLLVLTPLDMASPVMGERLYWLLLLALLCVRGGGWLSLDQLLLTWLRRQREVPDTSALPHVVIVGGGFGGIATASGLRNAPCRVTLIDQRNYHLFQPLLYQVATAGLSPADIASPIRGMLRTQANLRVLLGEVTGVDMQAREVHVGRSRMSYDTLVLATGARHSYFGRDEWGGLAPGLKTIDDATTVRRNLLLAFETAEAIDDPELRAAWLTFVIVGGGPTGVELAGAIIELARFGMEGEFRLIDPADARVVLVQSAPVLLPELSGGVVGGGGSGVGGSGGGTALECAGRADRENGCHDQRSTPAGADGALGGRRDGVTGVFVAGCGGGPGRTGAGGAGSSSGRLWRGVCDRRHRAVERVGRQAGAGSGAGGQAGRGVCRQGGAGAAARGRSAAAVSVSAFR